MPALRWDAIIPMALVAGQLILANSSVAQGISPTNATAFFTNIASRLLQSQMGLDLSHIPIWPTNDYTPAAHRLLQVSANLYDSTTNRPETGYPYLPSVFRPILRRDGDGTVFIAGYREVLDDTITVWGFSEPMLDLNNPDDRSELPPAGTPVDPSDLNEPIAYGVPLIIGAKKGFPNFNEFSSQTMVSFARFLQFVCPGAPDPTAPITATNQMYLIGMSNFLALEAWNSYSNAFPRPLEIMGRIELNVVITNDSGLVLYSNQASARFVDEVAAGAWPGYPTTFPVRSASFIVPVFTNITSLPFSTLRLNPPGLITPWTTNFLDPPNSFIVPRLWINIEPRVQFVILDTSTGIDRIVDYVNTDGGIQTIDLTSALETAVTQVTSGQLPILPPAGNIQIWDTNRVDPEIGNSPTRGIYYQIQVSLGLINVFWSPFNSSPFGGNDPSKAQQAFFYNLYGRNNTGDFNPHVRQPVFYAPYIPYTTVSIPINWEVNDPLVHYTAADLNDLTKTNPFFSTAGPAQATNINAGAVNYRFEPWGGGPVANNQSPTMYDISVKDPAVRRSDSWDFSSGEPLSFATLGRIHRGTPWQTVFLKATNILAPSSNFAVVSPRLPVWQKWIGNSNVQDAILAAPVADRQLISLLAPIINPVDPHSLLSINMADTNTWLATMDGIEVLTNSLSDSDLLNDYLIGSRTPVFDSLTMSSNSPQAGIMSAAITRVRATETGGYFRDIGDLLATPELSINSPWLNLASRNQLRYGLSDEAYEAVPSALLSRVRADSIGALNAAAGGVQVQFSGFDGYAYALEASSNLTDWTIIATNYPTNGVFTWTDSTAPGSDFRFYRSRLLP